jgi:hypothetical protein
LQREVENIIFTKHAIQRLRRRRITQDMVIRTIKSPDRRQPEADGDIKFIKTINTRNVHVVSHYLDDQNKWLVVSAWVRGEGDPKPLWQQILSLLLRLFRSGKPRR